MQAKAQQDWAEQFLELIRQVYLLLGGDPAELEGQSIVWAVATVCAHYDANGLPPNLTSKDRDSLTQLMGELKNHLSSAPPDFDPDTAANTHWLIDAIQADLQESGSDGV